MALEIIVNGIRQTFEAPPECSLLELLRGKGYYSVKHGCETGDCGACAVLVNGRAVTSCLMLAGQLQGKSVVTLEGLNGEPKTQLLQQAFIQCGAIQCGYCTPAMILVAKALLDKNPEPSEAEVREAFAGVLCRCTGYAKPVAAVLDVALREDTHG